MWLPGLVLLLLLGSACRKAAAEGPADFLPLELSLGKYKTILLNRTIPMEAVLRNVASNATVVIFQIHAHQKNVTISFDKIPSVNNSGSGVDQGLVSLLQPQQTVCTWYLQAVDADQVLSTAVSLSYTEKDPIPGGCNLEFALEIDPNIYLEYNLAETHIKFAPANLGYPRGANPPSCDSGTGRDTRWRLYYDIYQYFLPENDLSEAAFVSHLRKMSEVQEIEANGIRRMTLRSGDKTDLYFSSLPGQGVIYSVVVRDPQWNTSAAYVPIHTYACDLDAVVDNCSSLRRLSTKVFFTTLAILSLFICFFGHRFWKTDLFFMGFIFVAFFFFVTMTRTTDFHYDVNLGLTALAGVVGGLLLVAYWWRFGIVFPCMLVVGLVLGFLVAATLFFTPLGDYKVFQNDSVFWVTFCCFALMVPVVFVGCPRVLPQTTWLLFIGAVVYQGAVFLLIVSMCTRAFPDQTCEPISQLNILACGIIGSYTIVLAAACYLYTSLSYIGIDLLRRILNDDFRRAYSSVPFQSNDFILVAVWAMLAIGGITVQLRRERSEAPFPPHPYRLWRREKERRITNILDPSHHVPPLRERILSKLSQVKDLFHEEQLAGERTPLLL